MLKPEKSKERFVELNLESSFKRTTIKKRRQSIIKLLGTAREKIVIKVSDGDAFIYDHEEIAKLIYEKASKGIIIDFMVVLLTSHFITIEKKKGKRIHRLLRLREKKIDENFFINYHQWVRDERNSGRPVINFCLIDDEKALSWIPSDYWIPTVAVEKNKK